MQKSAGDKIWDTRRIQMQITDYVVCQANRHKITFSSRQPIKVDLCGKKITVSIVIG